MAIPRRSRLLPPVLLLSLVPVYGFAAEDPEPAAKSDTIEHVKQLEYDIVEGNRDDDGTDLEFATIPVTPADVRKAGFATPLTDADPATGPLERTFAFAGSYENGLQIVDVTDPAEATIVQVYDCGVSQGDVQVFSRDGGTYATYTQDDPYDHRAGSACYQEAAALGFDVASEPAGTFIVDVSDPYRPETVSFVPIAKGSHNQTVHPSGDYLYNSNSDLATSVGTEGIEVFSIRDLTAPARLGTLDLPTRPGLGSESHDLTFNDDGTRAYSAALSQTVIIDTTNPGWPRIVTSFVDPTINVEHQAEPVTLTDPILGTREFLIVEDEFAGASGAEQTCPSGGVHVYDITGDRERNPVKVGYWNIDDVATTEAVGRGRCTAHVFEVHEDEALMTIAFYNMGVSVVDLSGLVGVALGGSGVGMREVAFARFDDSDTWAVKAPRVDRDGLFHIYGNDQDRGMDVYAVDLDLPAVGDPSARAATRLDAAATGRDAWLSPAAALERLGSRSLPADYSPYCLLTATTLA